MEERWVVLGNVVRRRRRELGLTMAKAAARAGEGGRRGFDVQTWSGIERADRTSRRESVLRDLSWALGWTDDSARNILEGRAPIELDPTRPVPDEIDVDKEEPILTTNEHNIAWEVIEERRR
jgi:transcriptional regulator with XRE-family HTH domain